MIILPQSVECLEQNNMMEHIEEVARTCYQSFEKKCNGSAERMVNALKKNKHMAMLEHGTVYLMIPYASQTPHITGIIEALKDGISSRGVVTSNGDLYVSCNYRKYCSLLEQSQDALNEFVCEKPTIYHIKRRTLRCITNLQVATELIRHRRFSYAMESTRYCNYSKDKFGNGLAFITPCFLKDDNLDMDVWTKCMENIETEYLSLLSSGWSQQEAAQVLPKALKTQICMTGWDDDWDYFFDIRLKEKTGKVHPQMKELTKMMYSLINKAKKVKS